MSQYIFLDHFSTAVELSAGRELSNIMFPEREREAGPVVVWRSGLFCRRTSLTDCPCQIAAEWPWLSVSSSPGAVTPSPLLRDTFLLFLRDGMTSSSARLQRPHSRIKHTVYLISEALKSNKRAV